MGRVLGFILNPLGALFLLIFGSIGRKIDSRLSPGAGMVVATLVVVWAVSTAGLMAFALKDQIGRTVGLVEPPAVATVQGVVRSAETTRKKMTTVTQRLVVDYEHGGQIRSLTEQVTEPAGGDHAAGEPITIYLSEGRASLNNPDDRFVQGVATVIAGLLSAILLYLGWRYFRYRRRIFTSRPVLSHTGEAVLTTADRLKADAARARHTAQQAANKGRR